MASDKTSKNAPTLFGTFGGVFTPAILTILGVIMFLRAGYVVGQAGVLSSLIILAVAEGIVLLTAISMSAIATNTPVKAGGAYYLISRTMGPQFGSAIGLALYLAQALSAPFYILGFVQSVVFVFPALAPYFQELSLVVALLLFTVVYIGANWAIRSQYVVMAILGLSILAFLSGLAFNFDISRLAANWSAGYTEPGLNFWRMFAIYFPAVTGIMAGINMSGNLRNPARSLVYGTFAAVGTGALIYFIEIVLYGGAATRAELIDDPFGILQRLSPPGTGFLPVAGVFAAAISSAIGSLLTAPRVLQALARDRIIPGLTPFARGAAEPHTALWLTLFITIAMIAAVGGGDSLSAFDFVATVVTMLFLVTYGMINMAAFIESFGANPSFRPRFKLYHWSAALLGMLACLIAMFLINPVAALAAAAFITGLCLLINRWVYSAAFGDARRGFIYNIIAKNLLRLRNMRAHPKNWRPSILVMSGNPDTRPCLMQYAAWMEARCGLLAAAEIIIGDLREKASLRSVAHAAMEKLLRNYTQNAFPEVIIAANIDEGIRVLAQAHSIGPIKPNTVMFGWPSDPARIGPFVRHLQDLALLGKSLVCVVAQQDENEGDASTAKRIDVWWRGKRNGSLMLILAYLLTRNWEWGNTEIRVLRRIEEPTAHQDSLSALKELIQKARIPATAAVVVSNEPFATVMRQHSQDADAVFMGFEIPDDSKSAAFHANYSRMTEGMPPTLLVYSSGEADLLA
ncbi:MAG: amino acid permease [Kiritimatiellia bacterium]|jgi:amino acid transporter